MVTNEFIEKAIEIMDEAKGRMDWQRFNSCNAYLGDTVYVTDDKGVTHHLVPIKSYRTIVGFVDTTDGIAYEYGKYSRTTSKQFSQICNQRFRNLNPKRELVDVSTAGRW